MKLPKIELPQRPKGLRFEISAVAGPRFVLNAELAVIEIFDVIGGPGVTEARITGALRSIGPRPVTVQINSPGGDPFVGAAIYNLFRAHGYPITTQILGMAASAASIIAMAGDLVQTAKNGQAMIHRAQGAAFGDADTMRVISSLLEQTDAAMAGVYNARTGLPIEQLLAMMTDETFLSSEDMLSLGFADALLDRDAAPAPQPIAAEGSRSLRDLETRLRAFGVSKTRAARAAAAAWPALSRDAETELDLTRLLAAREATTRAIVSR